MRLCPNISAATAATIVTLYTFTTGMLVMIGAMYMLGPVQESLRRCMIDTTNSLVMQTADLDPDADFISPADTETEVDQDLHRLYILNVTSTIVYGLWAFSAILLGAGLNRRNKAFVFPWICFTGVSLLFSLIAIIMEFVDIGTKGTRRIFCSGAAFWIPIAIYVITFVVNILAMIEMVGYLRRGMKYRSDMEPTKEFREVEVTPAPMVYATPGPPDVVPPHVQDRVSVVQVQPPAQDSGSGSDSESDAASSKRASSAEDTEGSDSE